MPACFWCLICVRLVCFCAVTAKKDRLFVTYERANSFPGNIMLGGIRKVLSLTYVSNYLIENVRRTDYFNMWSN